MIYGLYLSAQGAEVQSARLDVIANNLANASTSAFKRDLTVFQAHRPYDVEKKIGEEPPGHLNQSTGGTSLKDVVTDFSDGPMMATGGNFDLAITGPGFFRVSDGQQDLLTRNGSFTVNGDGELVTQDLGYHVMEAGGAPIAIPPGSQKILISPNGIMQQQADDGTLRPIGQIDVVQPESFDDLTKIGNSFYQTSSPPVPADKSVQVKQGFLEGSGTRPVVEMQEMIEASRAFESNINLIRYQDEALGQLLQSAAR